MHYAAFERLSYLLSHGIRARLLPVQPYDVDEALTGSVDRWRRRCVVDDGLQRYGVHMHTVPVALRDGWPGALLLLWCSGGPLLETLTDDGCAGAVEKGPVLEDGHAKAVYHVQSIIYFQTFPGAVPKTLHELIPVVVAFVGAAIDHEAPRSMTIFLEIPLDVVGVVVVRGVSRRP